MIDYSVVIPVYNSSETLTQLVTRIEKVFVDHGVIYEIIFVNDGSTNPETLTTLKKLSNNFCVKVHHLMRNFGKPGAVLCGFKHAQGRYIITMDDDLQHLPEDIPALIAQKNHDVVIGKYKKSFHEVGKKIASKLKNSIDYYFLKKPKGIKSGPFKLIKSEVAKAACTLNVQRPMISALLYYCTNDVVNVPVTHQKRLSGSSGYTFKKGFQQLSQTMFGNSAVLLKLVAFIGLAMSLLSISVGIFFFIKKLLGEIELKGWASTFIVISFTSGLLLFAIGIIGEYLVRIINGIEHRPPYIEKEENEKS